MTGWDIPKGGSLGIKLPRFKHPTSIKRTSSAIKNRKLKKMLSVTEYRSSLCTNMQLFVTRESKSPYVDSDDESDYESKLVSSAPLPVIQLPEELTSLSGVCYTASADEDVDSLFDKVLGEVPSLWNHSPPTWN